MIDVDLHQQFDDVNIHQDSEWVSVKEEYPPCHGEIIIYCENGHFVAWRYVIPEEDDDQ